MKITYSRRYRRSPSRSRESAISKKDNQHEQTFFASPSHESFFKPNLSIHRKCDHCEAEDKKVSRMGGDEEKKIQKMDDKKEELHRQPDHKEEEKKIQKMGDEKKEDKEAHRQPDHKEEEKKIQKMDDKKEELHRQPDHKEEEKKIQKMGDEKKEDKEVHRQPDHKEEEKKIQKMEEKKEEVHRQADHKEEEKTISKKESGVGGSNAGIAATGSYIRSLNGKGSALPKNELHFFSKRMGYDFSHVKIHTGTEAERSAKDINAKAYAVDNNIVFNKGQYNPTTAEGKKLLAHELTHVIQQQGNEPGLVSRVTQLAEKKKEEEKPVSIEGKATKTKTKTSRGCGDVQVGGQTDANYKSSFKTKGKSRSSEECTDCSAPDCITSSGTVISTFKAHPVITLPDVPGGLSKCEAKAVRKFINGTLKQHEQQHKTAFKTYDGVIKTPYEFTGCKAELDLKIQSIHDGIDAQRAADANALSDALDPFNVPIPCNCKED